MSKPYDQMTNREVLAALCDIGADPLSTIKDVNAIIQAEAGNGQFYDHMLRDGTVVMLENRDVKLAFQALKFRDEVAQRIINQAKHDGAV